MDDDNDSPNVASDIDSQVFKIFFFSEEFHRKTVINFYCMHISLLRCHCRDLTHCQESLNLIDKDERSLKMSILSLVRTAVMVSSYINLKSSCGALTYTFFVSGDVDSCDDNEDNDEDSRKVPVNQKMRNRRTNNLNKNRIHSPFTNMSPNIITQQQYQSAYNMRGPQVNNLDLINGCLDSRYDIQDDQQQHAVNARQNRSRVFAHNNPYNRHETKL